MLLFRTAAQILQPLGITEEILVREVLGRARQLPLPLPAIERPFTGLYAAPSPTTPAAASG